MKPIIIVVYHGSANEQLNEMTSTLLTNKVKKQYPNHQVYEVFTSRIVQKRLINKRLTIEQCLNLIDNKKTDIYVLVTNLISGVELDFIKQELMNSNLNYHITPALFDKQDTIDQVALILGTNNNENHLFVGHGSKRKTNSSYIHLEDSFIKYNYNNHYICVIDGQPIYKDIEYKIDKSKKLNIYPLMFIAGYHAKKDVASLATSLENEYTKVQYHNISLGMLDKIHDIYLNNLNSIIKAS